MKRTPALDALGVVSVLIPLVMFGACGSGGNGGAGGSAGGTGKVDGGSGGSSGSTLDTNVPSGGSGGSTRDAGGADVPATSDSAIALDTGSPVDGAADWSGVDAPATSDARGRLDAGQSDPYFSNVVLLMHFDGANGATSFTDVKGHAVTPHGSAALSSTTSAFGGASGHFDGASGYLTLDYSDDWNFYAQDFTVEFFVYFKGGVSGQLEIPTLFSFAANSWTNWGGWQICYDVNWPENDQVPGTVFFIFTTTGSDEVNPRAVWTPAANAWYHLAIARHGSDFLYFVNGTLIGSQSLGPAGVADWNRVTPGSGPWLTDGGVSANAAINVTNSAILGIGAGIASDAPINTQSYFNGNLDEVRITKGVARYTANFTPPTGPFPDQ